MIVYKTIRKDKEKEKTKPKKKTKFFLNTSTKVKDTKRYRR